MKSLTLKAFETFSGDRYATQLTGVKFELVEPSSATDYWLLTTDY